MNEYIYENNKKKIKIIIKYKKLCFLYLIHNSRDSYILYLQIVCLKAKKYDIRVSFVLTKSNKEIIKIILFVSIAHNIFRSHIIIENKCIHIFYGFFSTLSDQHIIT